MFPFNVPPGGAGDQPLDEDMAVAHHHQRPYLRHLHLFLSVGLLHHQTATFAAGHFTEQTQVQSQPDSFVLA